MCAEVWRHHRRVWMLNVVLLVSGAFAQESPYLYGIHDHEPSPQEYLNHFNNAGVTGWVTATVEIGHDPSQTWGTDFRFISNQGHTVICRINNGYCSVGTIPLPSQYANFAQRCANFVQSSQGCTTWVIGNETNLASEWPPSGGHKSYVSPQSYAECFRLVYDAIKAVRPTHKVIPQALAPFGGPYSAGSDDGCGFTHDAMPINWVQYMNQMLTAIAASGSGPDGIALHINSRGYAEADIHSTHKVSANGQNLFFSFYVYKDWVDYGIPSTLWHLPLYATECNGLYYWKGGHPEAPAKTYEPGWMQEIYAEIHRYNTIDAPPAGKPIFHCVNMYRWCAHCDAWNIDGSSNPFKAQILSDLDQALTYQYQWNAPPIADFSASPLSGFAPLNVVFTDQSTGVVESRTWVFGDGGSSAVTHPARTYFNPGTYTVSLTATNSAGSNTKTRPDYITVTDPPVCTPYRVASFEDQDVGMQAVFRQPRYSSTTLGHLAEVPNVSTVADEVAAFDGTRSCKVQWAWVDTDPNRWLRLTTYNAPSVPNPAIDLRRPVRVRLRLDSGSLWVSAGVRETGADVPVGTDGGTAGTIEWIGCDSVTGGAPRGTLITAQPGVWQTVMLSVDPSAVRALTGDGVLAAANDKGVLEHLAFAVHDSPGPFTVYIDGISQPCPARGDFDFDGDVDQEDFGHLQACLSGQGIAQIDPVCLNARLDADLDVDADDVAIFLGCFSGPGQPPPPGCFD